MAALTDAEVVEILAPWLDHAVRYALDEHDGDLDRFLDELPLAEYVTIIHDFGSAKPLIDRYPGERVLYDDLYERLLGGVSCGGVVRVYKSTGEPFSGSEIRSALAGIKRDLLGGMDEAGDDAWEIHLDCGCENEGFEDEDRDRVVLVVVTERSNDSE